MSGSRPPILRLHEELIVDNFAGGGGASLGIEMALGRSPDIAVNHDPEAIAMHEANHPSTRHLCGDVWDVDPKAVCGGRPVGLAWFSPDCTYFSKSRGSKPFRAEEGAPKRRALAWLVVRWARAVRPRVVILENVEEFADWGPLNARTLASSPVERWREMAYRYPTIKVNGKTKLKHRHLVEQREGRPLRRDEHVHHVNEDRFDTADDNLELKSAADHIRDHKQKYDLTKACLVCGAVFTPHPTKRLRAKTCSKKCGYELRWTTMRANIAQERTVAA